MSALILKETKAFQRDRRTCEIWYNECKMAGYRDHRVSSVGATLERRFWMDVDIGNDRQAA